MDDKRLLVDTARWASDELVLREQRIEALTLALTEAHRVILHELDSGRTPYLLKAENGGKGLGYLEDTLSGVKL